LVLWQKGFRGRGAPPYVHYEKLEGTFFGFIYATKEEGDGARVGALLEQIDNQVVTLSADGACDATGVYEAAQEKGAGRPVRVLIPPGRNARPNPRPSAAQKERNRNILSIRELGRREWHKDSGYSKRAMVENAVYRYKTIMGRGMRSRTMAGQR
jgi:hypothetical protein